MFDYSIITAWTGKTCRRVNSDIAMRSTCGHIALHEEEEYNISGWLPHRVCVVILRPPRADSLHNCYDVVCLSLWKKKKKKDFVCRCVVLLWSINAPEVKWSARWPDDLFSQSSPSGKEYCFYVLLLIRKCHPLLMRLPLLQPSCI